MQAPSTDECSILLKNCAVFHVCPVKNGNMAMRFESPDVCMSVQQNIEHYTSILRRDVVKQTMVLLNGEKEGAGQSSLSPSEESAPTNSSTNISSRKETDRCTEEKKADDSNADEVNDDKHNDDANESELSATKAQKPENATNGEAKVTMV